MPLPEPILDGDAFFTGVNMRLDPGQLQPGLCAFAKNKRFVNGKAATRPGIKKMPWTNKVYDAWTNDVVGEATKAYVTGDIVTYSGVSAEIEGEGATVSSIEDGTGEIYLKDVRSLNLQNGDFSSSSNWNFGSSSGITTTADLLVQETGFYTTENPFYVAALPIAVTPPNDTITFENGGVFTITTVNYGIGAFALRGQLTVADVMLHEEGIISSGDTTWVHNNGASAAEVSSGTTAANLYQDIGTLKGCSYEVTYTVDNWTAGSIQIFISGISGGTKRTYSSSSSATFSDTIIPKGINSQRLYIQASGGFRGRITNISVVASSLPDEVDILGTFQQWTNNWRAAGPGSNVTAGPFFKAKQNNTDKPPLTSFSPLLTATINKSGGYSAGSSLSVSVYSLSRSIPNSSVLTFLNGETFTLSQTAGAGDTVIKGNLSGSISNGAVGTGTPASSTVDTTYWEDIGHRTYGYGTVYGAGIFRDPQSVEYLLVATSDGVYATKEANPSRKLAMPSGVSSISSDVDFVQCFNVVIMFRGENEEPLMMERVDEGFKSITPVASDTDIDENDSDGTEQIPNAATGLFFSNRLLVPHRKDLVAASDFLNYTRYQPVMANFRINQGSEDELISLVRINDTTVACFKSNSIYIASNVYGNLSDLILDEVTREYGAIGRNSIVQVGSDVAFLSSKKGVTSLSIASNGKVTAVDIPLSEAIQPLIDRINWNTASNSAAAYHNNRLYMAVPIDGSSYNNVILVYDFLTKAWAGYDDGEAVKVKQFVETTHQGKRRLFFLSTDGFINLYDDTLTDCGFVDEVPNPNDSGLLSVAQINDEIVTRGYSAGNITTKKWKSAEIQVETSDPNFVVRTQFEGPEENDLELTPVGGKTLSRTKYSRPFDKVDYAQTMANNDFSTKFREDYSVKLAHNSETGGVDIASGWTGTFDPDIHQTSSHKYRYRGDSRFVQLKISNTNGRVGLIGTKVGAVPGENLTVIET